MGRIAGFVIVVGGLSYLAIGALVRRLTGEAPSPVLAISLAVIVAVILWTVLIWVAGERLQKGDDRGSRPSNGE